MNVTPAHLPPAGVLGELFSRKNKLPAPLPVSRRILSFESVRQINIAAAPVQILLVEQFDPV